MIDVGNIASMYSDIYASSAAQSADQIKNKMSGLDKEHSTDDELMNACKEFEAYFVEQMYKGMMKTIPQNEEMSNSTSTLMDYYKDQMMQTAAKQTTEQNSLGLAQMLYEQMKRNYGVDSVK